MMRRQKYRIYLTVIALILYIAGFNDLLAVQPGGQAGSFLRLGIGADRVAMGNTGAALIGGGMNWYYNPAGLPAQKHRQATFGYRFMSLDRSITYTGFSTPLAPRAGLAFGFMRAGDSEVPIYDSNGNRLDVLSISENLIHGSFAIQPHNAVALGISIKWLIFAIPDIKDDDKNLYAYGMSVDLGARVVVTPALSFGLQVRDLGATYSWETPDVWGDEQGSSEDDLPILLRAGTAWKVTPELTLAGDLVIDPDRAGDEIEAFEPHFGVEYRRRISDNNSFALRGGINNETITFGFGLGIKLKYVYAEMDYAFYIEEVAPGSVNLIGWKFIF